MNNTHAKHSAFADNFSAAVRRALLKRNILIIGICALPGDGPMPWANSSRGYQLDNNGTGMIRTHAEVVALSVA